MNFARNRFLAASVSLLSIASFTHTSYAKETPYSVADDSDDAGYLTFFLDNDLFAGRDQDYTNGARLSYITEGRPLLDVPFIEKNLHRFSAVGQYANPFSSIWGLKDTSKVEYAYGFSLTQLMFTPETQTTLTAPPGERPYAGWAGIGFSLHARNEKILNSVEISLGVVGPHAQAQETQDFIHDIRNIDRFQGWDSQIPNEITLNLHFDHKRRWTDLRKVELPFDLELDGFHEIGYSIGNFLTEAHVGFVLRLGWNIPVEFSDARLTPTAHTQKLYADGGYNRHDWSCYFIGGARITGVLHDITLDGPLFRDFDTNVSREPWVGEIYAGFGIRYRSWEFNYVHTFRSKQFKTQSESPSFGSIAIRKRF